ADLLRHGHAEPAAAGDGLAELLGPAPVAVARQPVVVAEVGAEGFDRVADRELVVGEIEIHDVSADRRRSRSTLRSRSRADPLANPRCAHSPRYPASRRMRVRSTRHPSPAINHLKSTIASRPSSARDGVTRSKFMPESPAAAKREPRPAGRAASAP